VTTGYKMYKAPVELHQQQMNTMLLQAAYPSCRPTNSVKALKGKNHTSWTCLLQAHLGVFQPCLWPLKARGLPWRSVAKPSDVSAPYSVLNDQLAIKTIYKIDCRDDVIHCPAVQTTPLRQKIAPKSLILPEALIKYDGFRSDFLHHIIIRDVKKNFHQETITHKRILGQFAESFALF